MTLIEKLILTIVIILTLNVSTGKLFTVATQHKQKILYIKKVNEYYKKIAQSHTAVNT